MPTLNIELSTKYIKKEICTCSVKRQVAATEQVHKVQMEVVRLSLCPSFFLLYKLSIRRPTT